MESRMPAIFVGHGSPMLALEHGEVANGLEEVGNKVIERHGKPKGILAVSAHFYTHGSYVVSSASPKQIYDMYGFPKELYAFQYPAVGSPELARHVLSLLKEEATPTNQWGIDHGVWTVLCHMFPKADVPVVEFSVDGDISPEEAYEIGKKLAPIREEGYLILGSGNVVHNLREVEWDNPSGSEKTIAFNEKVKELALMRNDDALIHFEKLENSSYAIPTPDHYLPLIYLLGASLGEKPEIFNSHCELGSIAMTGFAFGL